MAKLPGLETDIKSRRGKRLSARKMAPVAEGPEPGEGRASMDLAQPVQTTCPDSNKSEKKRPARIRLVSRNLGLLVRTGWVELSPWDLSDVTPYL